jgi:hypothetical protein
MESFKMLFDRDSLRLVRESFDALNSALVEIGGVNTSIPGALYLYYTTVHIKDTIASYILLREAEQHYASKILLRSALEAMYRVLAVHRSPELIYRVAFTEYRENVKLIEKLNADGVETRLLEFHEKWRKVKTEIQAEFPATVLKDQELKAWDAAVAVGLESNYDSQYRYLCQFTHAGLAATRQIFNDSNYLDNPIAVDVAVRATEVIESIGKLENRTTGLRHAQGELIKRLLDTPQGQESGAGPAKNEKSESGHN